MNGKLTRAEELDISGNKILIRGDLDVDDGDNPRVWSVREIVKYVQERGAAKIKVLGHRETNYPICEQLSREFPDVEFDDRVREDLREKENNDEYASELANGWEVYINESFAVSHRKHTSLVALPQLMRKMGKQTGIGLRFEKELEMLSGVWEKPGRRVLVIGGVKVADKQRFAEEHKDNFAVILKGGLLPGVELRSDGLDISDETRKRYVAEIEKAEVILAAGVMGKYEDSTAIAGTKAVLEAIAGNKKAYKVAGGGDIEMAISTFGLADKFDWISVGGGAMLEYLGKGTLPGMEAVMYT